MMKKLMGVFVVLLGLALIILPALGQNPSLTKRQYLPLIQKPYMTTTPTRTATATSTSTATKTNTRTATATSTNTRTATSTSTRTATATSTLIKLP